jgi:iron complex outermembrane recepter protein
MLKRIWADCACRQRATHREKVMARIALSPPPATFINSALLSMCISMPSLADQAVESSSLETVRITAQKIEAQLKVEQALTPGAVSVIDSNDLYQRNVTGLADMLRYVPGLWAESAAGQDDLFISSRGSNLDSTDYDKNGVKLLQDGLPVTTADGNNHNRVIDPLSARYAVVAHGANALTYGASTLGGAIDFTSPTARTSPPMDLFVSGGSNGQINARVSAGQATDTLDGLVTLENKNWDGYRDHSSQYRKGAYLNAGWKVSDSVTTRVYGTYIDNHVRLPGTLTRAQMDADRDQASAPALSGDYGKDVETRRVASKTTWQINATSSLDFGVSYEAQSLFHPIVDRILVDFDGPGPAEAVEVFSLIIDIDHRDWGAMSRYNVKAGDHNFIAGINFGDGTVKGGNYRNNSGQKNGLTEYVHNVSNSLEAFAVDRWRLAPAWTLVYGGQFVDADRDVKTTNAASGDVRNPKGSYSAFNPRLGVIYALSDETEIFGSMSRAYEAPTTFELEDDVRANNSTLDAMHGTVIEAGIRGKSLSESGVRWNWDIAMYYARIRDEILSVDDPAAPGNSLTTNIDKTTHAGIEALVGASFEVVGSSAHRIEPLVSLTVNDFSFDSDLAYGNNNLPTAPDYILRGEALYRNVSGFFAGPTFDFIGKRYADFSNIYTVGSYNLLGLRGGFTGNKWEVFGELRNLLDKDYVATLSVLNEAASDSAILNPGAPRSAYVGVRVQL